MSRSVASKPGGKPTRTVGHDVSERAELPAIWSAKAARRKAAAALLRQILNAPFGSPLLSAPLAFERRETVPGTRFRLRRVPRAEPGCPGQRAVPE